MKLKQGFAIILLGAVLSASFLRIKNRPPGNVPFHPGQIQDGLWCPAYYRQYRRDELTLERI